MSEEYTEYRGALIPSEEAKRQRKADLIVGARKMFLGLLKDIVESGFETTLRYGDNINGDDQLWLVDHPTDEMGDRIRHRIDGPAAIDQYGNVWYVAGLLHRVDGPAIEHSNGAREWYVYGLWVDTYESFQAASGCSDEDLIVLRLRWGEMMAPMDNGEVQR